MWGEVLSNLREVEVVVRVVMDTDLLTWTQKVYDIPRNSTEVEAVVRTAGTDLVRWTQEAVDIRMTRSLAAGSVNVGRLQTAVDSGRLV